MRSTLHCFLLAMQVVQRFYSLSSIGCGLVGLVGRDVARSYWSLALPDWLLLGQAAEHCGKMEGSVGRLEVEALRRKERLKELRNKRQKDEGEPESKVRAGEEEEQHRELKLRNYTPQDDVLKERQVPQAKPISVEEKVKEQLEAAKPEPIIEEVDLANLAPRKPDWDLKRDVAKKLEKLEKRTQRAIAELIRERLKGQEEELATAVASANQEDEDSD
ncbi:hypothetical protein XELAEV_18032741mg [Xenopus laevis]|uniref:Coiled-coil domain-containing protein 12 n=1 Tax=Xenopus laevis TaxID=8355 RepID=A0A974CI74_XENLA|nr:hypothetical protein XELAEV_18032741mg [Xenopus laevis]